MRFTHKLSYYALILFSAWLRSLSEIERNRFGVRLARLSYHLLPIRKKDASENIHIAFPEKSLHERTDILKKAYSFFAQNLFQFLSFPKSYFQVNIDVYGQHLLERALDNGRGIILVTGHFSKWEIMAAWLGYSKYPAVAVAQKQKNRGADVFFREFREKTGMGIIYRKSSIKDMYKILEDNKILVLGSDQDAKNRGVFVRFFNKPASTPKGAARFHLSTGSPVFFISCHLEPRGKYIIHIQQVKPNGPPSIESITQAFTDQLEEKIRLFPEQYFWFHRRWKTKPEHNK